MKPNGSKKESKEREERKEGQKEERQKAKLFFLKNKSKRRKHKHIHSCGRRTTFRVSLIIENSSNFSCRKLPKSNLVTPCFRVPSSTPIDLETEL